MEKRTFSPCETDDTEPVYEGRRLSEWVRWTEDQRIDRSPSAEACQAAEALKSLGPDMVIPFLLQWMKSPRSDAVILGGALKCFQILGPTAKSAIQDLTALLNEPVKTREDSERRNLAAEALSYLGLDALPIVLEAAKKTEGGHKWIMISNLANFGHAGAAAKMEATDDRGPFVREAVFQSLQRMIPMPCNDPERSSIRMRPERAT